MTDDRVLPKGTQTYCENGHRLGVLRHDLRPGDVMHDAVDLDPGMLLGASRCPTCGGRTAPKGGAFYLADGEA